MSWRGGVLVIIGLSKPSSFRIADGLKSEEVPQMPILCGFLALDRL
ncbi:hypothetical protein M595_3221 [Lyngbya aestuarii BL J]|uniref:Uncharacterized protein n=1 Tax=Lyngbya aestuarii BL J TaxID=1348334 RepID=U7QK57_9CYAN|nr:hypothetical protein M595_3221 [Lyngbya aestuarii BL J]